MIYQSLINDIADVRKSAPGVDVTLTLQELNPYLTPAYKMLVTALGDELYSEIQSSDLDNDIREVAVSALSNLTMYNYKIWEVIAKRHTQDKDTYKYELEMMQEAYLNNYFSALDSLYKGLSESNNSLAAWNDSPTRKTIEGLMLKSADEFNSFYGIDSSYYFFYSTVYIQRKVIDRFISGIDHDKLDETQMRRLKGVVAQMTVVFALRQLDFIQLPKSIRNSRSDGASRNGPSEQNFAYELSDRLFAEAQEELSQLFIEINRPSGSDIESTSNNNKEEYKFFFMS